MESLITTSLTTSIVLFFYSLLAFLLARLLRDNSVMDILYGPAFVFGLGGAAIIFGVSAFLPLVVLGCITLWAMRLAVRIGRKNWGKPEDARYAAWREQWMKRGRWYFWVRSYLQVNLLQCVIILLVALPGVIAIAFPGYIHSWFVAAGLAVFGFGLAYEAIADWQLDRFLANKRAGTEDAVLLQTGLFRYSRRPNYFGETLVWWGLAIMVLPLPLGYLALLSPLLITYIVTKVTGPMLEDGFLERYPDEYGEYRRTTNYFIPGLPANQKTSV